MNKKGQGIEDIIKSIFIAIVIIAVIIQVGQSFGWFNWVKPTLAIIWLIVKWLVVVIFIGLVIFGIIRLIQKLRKPAKRRKEIEEQEKRMTEKIRWKKAKIADEIKDQLKDLSEEKKIEVIDREYARRVNEEQKRIRAEAIKQQEEEEEKQRKEEETKRKEAEKKHKEELKRKKLEEQAIKIELKIKYADAIKNLSEKEKDIFLNQKFKETQEQKNKEKEKLRDKEERRIHTDSGINELISFLEDYEPPIFRDEKEFERSIYSYLKGRAIDMDIQFQQRLDSGGRIDIVINKEIGVELKIAESRNHLRDLIGQIEEYAEIFDKLLVIILDVGYVDDNTIEHYKNKFEEKKAEVFVMKGELKRHAIRY